MPYIESPTENMTINGKIYAASAVSWIAERRPPFVCRRVFLIYVSDEVYLSQMRLELRRKFFRRKPFRFRKKRIQQYQIKDESLRRGERPGIVHLVLDRIKKLLPLRKPSPDELALKHALCLGVLYYGLCRCAGYRPNDNANKAK